MDAADIVIPDLDIDDDDLMDPQHMSVHTGDSEYVTGGEESQGTEGRQVTRNAKNGGSSGAGREKPELE